MATIANLNDVSATDLVRDVRAAETERTTSFLKGIADFFRSANSAIDAQRELERLQRMSDAQLKQMGLTREDLSQRVIDQLFTK